MADSFDSLLSLLQSGTEVNHRQLRLELQDLSKKFDRELTLRNISLHRDLGQAFLLLHALVELCLRKGVISSDELQAMTHELDAKDGNVDGTFNPDDPESPYPATDSPAQFVRRLAQQHRDEAAADPS